MGHTSWNAVVGLTGGLGSGKSTVLEMFRRKGAFVLDADRIVHDLLDRDASTKSDIKRKFGPNVFNGKSLDRRALASIVFASRPKRKILERIIHPRVRRAIRTSLERNRGTIAVCDIPLLYESGWEKGFDRVVVVSTKEDTRRKRLLKRGLTIEDIAARSKAQWPLKKKIKKADFVVDNSGARKKTQSQVDKIWRALNF